MKFSESKPLRFYELLPRELQHRLLLDYPLDVLLCRSCQLMAYEKNLVGDVESLHDAILDALSWSESCDNPSERRETLLRVRAGLRNDREPYPTETNDVVARYANCLKLVRYGDTSDPSEYRYKKTCYGAIRFPSPEWADRFTSSNQEFSGQYDVGQVPPRIAYPSDGLAEVASTGNILIRGRPGTCKSTLALQLAAACASKPNYCMSLFICLEEQPEQVLAKCNEMHWADAFKQLDRVTNLDSSSSSEEIGRELDRILRPQCEERAKKHVDSNRTKVPFPLVLIPELSPRCLRASSDDEGRTFQTRYEQLERLLRGFRWLKTNIPDGQKHWLPELRVVCIDSLSALAERPLTREEIYRVFDLFTNYGVVGIVTAEDQTGERADTMEYLADVVIDLLAEHDDGYAVRYLEIKKSRHQHQVYGLHPFVVRNYRSARNQPRIPTDDAASLPLSISTISVAETEPRIDVAQSQYEKSGVRSERAMANLTSSHQTLEGRMFQAVMVYPSIHYNVGALKRDETHTAAEDFRMGIDELNNILSHGLKRPGVVTISGPRGTYKTHIAQNFLLHGLAQGESVMLIHLGGGRQFRPDVWRSGCSACKHDVENMGEMPTCGAPSAWFMSREVALAFDGNGNRPNGNLSAECQCQPHRWADFEEQEGLGLGVGSWYTGKFVRRVWQAKHKNFGNGTPARYPVLVELDFGPGALLPEQFLKFMRDVFRQLDDRIVPAIRRVVVDDVSLIGTSYPFLRSSKTSGDLFLSALVHVAGYHKCDTVLLGTIGEYGESDDVVKRAATLAGSVLKCDFCDVFGARYITVAGEGLMVGRRRDPTQPGRTQYGEYVPAVIEPKEKGVFGIDTQRLEGLVGFEQRQVHRPGVVVSLFSEGEILQRYNGEVRTLLERSFASPSTLQAPRGGATQGALDNVVSVLEFDSGKSGPLHESLGVLSGKPIDKTVICALDEFFTLPETEKLLCDVRGAMKSVEWDTFREKLWYKEPDYQNHGQHASTEVLKRSARVDVGEVAEVGEPSVVSSPKTDPTGNTFLIANTKASQKRTFAVPYYSNVLVFAYNSDYVHQEDDWLINGRVESWAALLKVVSPTSPEQHNRFVIDCGSWSGETLACILLDLLFWWNPGHRTATDLPKHLSMADLLRGTSISTEVDKNSSPDAHVLEEQLLALRKLFRNSIRVSAWKRQMELLQHAAKARQSAICNSIDCKNKNINSANSAHRNLEKFQAQMAEYGQKLIHNSATYICWYTQLRELIAEHPDLGSKLRVAALPGGGICGDWYLGLVQGSVSVKLGENIIKMLVGWDEDGRRFTEGVGLPVREYSKNGWSDTARKAWKRGEVGLRDLIGIHSNAKKRSQISDYLRIRDTLAAICEQVIFSTDDDPESIRELVIRLRNIVAQEVAL